MSIFFWKAHMRHFLCVRDPCAVTTTARELAVIIYKNLSSISRMFTQRTQFEAVKVVV